MSIALFNRANIYRKHDSVSRIKRYSKKKNLDRLLSFTNPARTIVLLLMLISASALMASVERNKKDSVIRVVGDWAFPPYEFIGRDGKPTGFVVDLLNAVMSDMKKEYRLELTNFLDAKAEMTEGKAEIISTLAYTDERVKQYAFSLTNCFVIPSIVCHRNSKVQSLSDMNGKRVIMQQGEVTYDLLRDNGIECDTLFYDNMNDGLKVLERDSMAIAFCGQDLALYLIKNLNYANLEVRPLQLNPLEYCFASNKHNSTIIRKMNLSLAKLKASGKYEQIYRKWFPKTGLSFLQKHFQSVIAVISVLFILSLIAFLFAKRKIKKATKLLSHANEQLRKSVDKYQAIFDSIMIGVVFADENGYVIDVNDKAIEIFGASSKEDFLNRKKSVFSDPSIEEDVRTEVKNGSKRTYSFIIDFDDKIRRDFYNSKRQGRANIELRSMPLFNRDKEIKGYLFSITDVTDIYNLNRQFKMLYYQEKSIMTAMPVGVEIYDANGILVYINDANAEIYGISNINKLIESNICLFDNPNFNEETKDKLRNGESGKVEIDFDFAKVKEKSYYSSERNGIIQIKVNYNVIKNPKGKVLRYILISTDVTTTNLANRAIEEARNKAQENDRLKSTFLANMSHEIRTPLNAIVGFSDLLIEAESQEEKEEYGKIITNNNELLLRLINDILDLSKMESGMVEMHREEIDLKDLVEDIYQQFLLRVTNPEVEFRVEYPEKEIKLVADKERMVQVLNNFLTNAIKYTPSGSITLGYCEREDKVIIWVKDTGIGIPQEKQKRVFSRFDKLDSMAQGTGLGLFICKTIAEAEKGNIGFHSEEGKGSLFYIEYNKNMNL